MSAAEALRAARMAGVDVRIEDGGLALEAQAPPSAEILELLARHKPGIVALLRPGRDGWSAEDWQGYFDGRAGIVEFDGGLPRPEAEARAFECCVVEWLNRNFERSAPGRCLACGGADHTYDALLPHGIEPTGHVWLHSRCWAARCSRFTSIDRLASTVPRTDPVDRPEPKPPITRLRFSRNRLAIRPVG